MSRVVKLNPTGYLRFVRITGAPSDEPVPTMQCGIHRYKLQQKWLGTDSSVQWFDVQVEYPTLETEVRCDKCAAIARTGAGFAPGAISCNQPGCPALNRGVDR